MWGKKTLEMGDSLGLPRGSQTNPLHSLKRARSFPGFDQIEDRKETDVTLSALKRRTKPRHGELLEAGKTPGSEFSPKATNGHCFSPVRPVLDF